MKHLKVANKYLNPPNLDQLYPPSDFLPQPSHLSNTAPASYQQPSCLTDTPLCPTTDNRATNTGPWVTPRRSQALTSGRYGPSPLLPRHRLGQHQLPPRHTARQLSALPASYRAHCTWETVRVPDIQRTRGCGRSRRQEQTAGHPTRPFDT